MDDFVEDQPAVGGPVELGEPDDALQRADVVVQVAGHQQVAAGGQVGGAPLPGGVVPVGLGGLTQQPGDNRGVGQVQVAAGEGEGLAWHRRSSMLDRAYGRQYPGMSLGP